MTEWQNWFLPHQAQTTANPIGLNIERAEGLYLYDTEGKKYLDLVSGVAVSNIGHRHPKVVQAIKDQVDRHLHVMVYGEYAQTPQGEFARDLAAVLPPQLNTVYFVNSGTEANEGALKLAKRVTGRSRIVSCRGAYHGSTHGSLSVSGNETKKYAFRPLLPDVHFIPFNDIDALEKIDHNTAAFILETIQGDAGIRIPTLEYLQAVRKKCDETGTMLIMDEVQTGFGRTGKLFAFEHFGVEPDILTIGKGMAGGMPMGAFISSKANMEQLQFDPMLGHITTFGGHPVCCAAGVANLKVLQDENLIAAVEQKGALFKELLVHSEIREVRQIGLMMAVDLKDFEMVSSVFDHCLENGVIGFWFLSCNHAFRIAPPLTIGEEEIRNACQIILEGIKKAAQ